VNQGELGLGKNSTFLNALASSQKISSQAYSFFWGTDSAISDDPRNGSLTLGGYDQALISDAANTTTKFDRSQSNCREGMLVDLTGLALQLEGGGTQSLFNGTEKLRACIVPTLSSVLTLPQQYWNKMAKTMGVELSPGNNGESDGLFFQVSSIKPESAWVCCLSSRFLWCWSLHSKFTGNLTISINNAINVTIPNKQLIFDEPYIASDGHIKRNISRKNIPVVRYTDPNSAMPRLGGMFFSSAYLMVNHDKNVFTIAPIQEKSGPQKLMGVDSANGCIALVEERADTASGAPDSSPSPSAESISSGAIAGIVIGVLAVLAIIVGVVFLLRRRKNVTMTRPFVSELPGSQEGVPVAEKYGYSTSEMYAGSAPGELSAHTSMFAVELDGRSKAAEVSGQGFEREGLVNGQRR
jgi:hypothetical protein